MRWEQNSSKDKLRANDSAQRRFHANKLCQPALSDSFIPIFQSQVISQNFQTFLYHIFKVIRSIFHVVRLLYTSFSKSGYLPNLSDSICQLSELSKSHKIVKEIKQSSIERDATFGIKLFSSWDTVMARVKFLQHMSGSWSVLVGSTMGYCRCKGLKWCLLTSKQHRRKWKWLKISCLRYCFIW